METQNRRAISEEAGNDERALRSTEVIYPGKEMPSGRTGTGPCGVSRGGCSPMCRTPCCSHLVPFSTVAAPLLLVINHCGASRSASSGFTGLSRMPSGFQSSRLDTSHCLGPIISRGLTHWSNWSFVTRPNSIAASRRVEPFSCACLAILAALSYPM